MGNKVIRSILYISILTILSCPIVTSQETQNVFILVIDGARYSETFGDPSHQYIPHIWNELKPLGALYTSFYNQGVTQTNSGHSSILTGTWQSVNNDGSERPHEPTLFEYFRKEKVTSSTYNYVILGKDKLDILAYSDHPDYGDAYGASVQASSSQYKDSIAFDNLKTVISAQHPKLAIVNFPGTDRAGHDGPWANYVSKLQYADSLINEFWNLIQSDLVYQNKTTVFITNDHGRHLDGIADGFRGHGDGCDGCRHVSLLVIGPDTPPGIIDSTTRTQIDIAPTVALLLKFTPYLSNGAILTSAIDFNLPQTRMSYVSSGWNLLSIPLRLNNHAKRSIYPTAGSDAFRYTSSAGYQSTDTLGNGIGYWIRFSTPESVAFTGYDIRTDTIDVVTGWNPIGSISQEVAVTTIAVLPPEMACSQFFGYDDGYYIADTLKPFRGYWIKVNQNGKLILSK